MKIRDTRTGELYQLAPGSTMEIERTNPFFNDGGEQSLPMDLPDTPQNRRLTGHPAELANSHRPPSDRYVEIEDGAYHVRARQVVLSASWNGKISTSYLLQQSDLYALIGERQLIDIFTDRTVGVPTTQESGIPTLDEKIAFLDSLRSHTDQHYDIFPVAMTLTDTAEHTLGYRLLNARGKIFTHMDGSGKSFLPEPTLGSSSYLSGILWLNAEARTGTFANDTTLNLQKGYYMSPFIRAIYVLQEMIASLGYTLLHQPDPVIDSMVFVNNTIDAIVTEGDIQMSDLLPDCSCSDLLDLFRYKFGMEFVCDATAGTVTMLPFATAAAAAATDLTRYLAGQPEIEYREERQRLTLSPSGMRSGGSVPSIISELNRYADPRWDAVRGGWVVSGKRGFRPVTDLVIDGTAGYDIGDTGETPDAEDMKSPDAVPSMVQLTGWLPSVVPSPTFAWTFPFIGDERALHSKLSDEISQDDSPELEERPKLDMMLLLPFTDFRSYPRGGLTDYDYYKFYLTGVRTSAGIGGSLCYHGADGLFERYWRTRDELTRNALNSVRVRLLLPQQLKMSLAPQHPVLLHGTPLLIDTLSIQLGQDDAETQSTLLSTVPQEPTVHAPASESLPATGYHWQLKRSFRQYPSPSESTAAPLVYPPVPTAGHIGQEICKQYSVAKLSPGESLGVRLDLTNDTLDQYAASYIVENDYGVLDLYNPAIHTSPAYLYIISWYECIADE